MNFRKCHLDGVDFTDADLAGCDFRDATFDGCRLQNAHLASARFEGADLRMADLGVLSFSTATCFKGAIISKNQATELLHGLGVLVL